MEKVKLFSSTSSVFNESSSARKIKVGSEKANRLFNYKKQVDTPVVEKTSDFHMPTFVSPEKVEVPKTVVSETAFETPNFDDYKLPALEKKDEVVEEKVSEKPVSVVKTREYVVPDIKGPSNTLDNRSEKIRAWSEKADPTTFVGKVLVSGVSKLDENKREKEMIEAVIANLNETKKELEDKENMNSTSQDELTEALSRTTDLSDVIAKIKSSAVNSELAKINESVRNLEGMKQQNELERIEIQKAKADLDSKISQQKTRLISAQKNESEICDAIDKDLTTAKQIEELDEKKKLLQSKLSLTEEKPKEVSNIRNPFEELRMKEDEIGRTI